MEKIIQERSFELPPHSRITYPSIPVGHPQYQWTSGADVQKTWMRFGWKPVNPVETEVKNAR